MISKVDRSGRRPRRPRLGVLAAVAVVVGVASLGGPGDAVAADTERPTDKALCAETYRNAQLQRKNGALKRARESLLLCASDRCPSLMQPDCTRWLTEVEAALPSLAFAAKGEDGSDLTTVRVTMDGQFVTATLDGKAIPVDPGSHLLRFEHGTDPPIEQTIIVHEGEKARVVNVSWEKEREAPRSSDAEVRRSSGPPASAWVFGGLGVAGLATFGVLALHGMQRRSDLEKECFGSCTEEQVQSVKTELAIADAALGVGVVSLAVSAVLFLSSGGASPATGSQRGTRAAWLGVVPRRDGGAAGISGRF